VTVAGVAPAEASRRIGYVPQQPSLFPWLRIDDNVALPLRLRGMPRAERRIQAQTVLARVGLAERAKAYPHECSGGMQQRVMFARQLAAHATHWLLDEPFAALDERTRHRLQALLLDLRTSDGLSMLFVTHSIEEAVALADRIVIVGLAPGRVVRTLEVADSHPRDRLSSAFFAYMADVRRQLASALGEA